MRNREGGREKFMTNSSLQQVNPVSSQVTSKDRLLLLVKMYRYKRVHLYFEILGWICRMCREKDAFYDPLKTQINL